MVLSPAAAGKLEGVDVPAAAAPSFSPPPGGLTASAPDTVPASAPDTLPASAPAEAPPSAPEAGAIAVRVNGAATRVASDLSVQQLVARWCPSPDGVAVARNREVVPRSLWPATTLHPGDEVEIVTAVAGG